MNKLALCIAGILGLAACKEGCGPAAGSGASGVKVGLVTDVGGRGDESFNDSALRGLEMWAAGKKYTASGYQPLPDAEFQASITPDLKNEGIAHLSVTPVVLQAKASEDYEPDLELLVSEKVSLTVGVGFMLENAIEATAKKRPEGRFLLIDSPILDAQNKPYQLPNVMTAVFRENESCFLVGAVAALASRTGKVGFVGGMEIPIIKRFEAGFVAGLKVVNPEVSAQAKRVYTGNFDDSASGKRVALDLYNQGVDVVFHAAGAGGIGVIQAAKEQNKFAIGCDADQAHLAPANVLTSTLKHVDYAVYRAIKSVVEKKFQPGDAVLGLRDGGVGVAPITLDFPGKDAAIARVEKLRKAVIEGQIKVPAAIDELDRWSPPTSE
jgi:basic membrane protein A and related proteins